MTTNPGTAIVAKIIFPVDDLDGAIAFYRSLGFTVDAHDDGYAWVQHRGGELLHLARVDGLDVGANRSAGYLHVQDAADWHRAWVWAGADPSPLTDRPWGMREFELRDPAGNLLRVGQNL